MKLASVALSVLLSLSLVVGMNHFTPTNTFSQVRQATWLVDINGQGSCSGVLIKKLSKGSLMLTAAHCDGDNLMVGGKPVIKLKKDVKSDLLLLWVEVEGPVVEVAGVRPSVDEKVAIVGYPLGMGQVATEGRLQTLTVDGAERYMLVTAPGIFGNSGGPVVVRSGFGYKVVGIVSALPIVGFGSPITHLMIVSSTESINKFINE